jgi:biopolymer transport protein ExbD
MIERDTKSADPLPQHRTRRTPRPRMTLNVTAMIDVVFLLLIYFLAVTNFKLGEEAYRLDLPERGQVQEIDPFQLDQEPLRIRVASQGTAVQPYRIQIEGPYEEPASFAALYEFLVQRQLSPVSPGGLFAQDHPIIIEPQSTARWEHVIGAFNAAARAEYTNITFAGPAS